VTANEAAAFGLSVEEASSHLTCEVWPDNAATVNVFVAMATQWRTGPGGVVGLDYSALPAVFDLLDVPRLERAEVFDGFRLMEDAALGEIRKRTTKQ